MSAGVGKTSSTTAKVVVATTVALSFISFWRGASIVLADLASSAFYAGGIAETAVGPAAPWFVLGVMLFSFAVRSVYMESCSMFVRGGVYIVVKDSMGPFVARLSVSSLVFDYILTGPISVVSAGQYLGHLLDEIAKMLGQSFPFNVNYFSAFFAVIVTVYFWWQNTKGMHESSGKALRIMQITTVMVVALLIWCPLTIILRGHITLPPAPLPRNLQFGDESLGWFKGTIFPSVGAIALMIAIGHSLLSMSGFETLAQVYREIAYPKMKNLKITANIVCWYAVICTGVITVFAGMIISPSDIKNLFSDDLLGGLAMRLVGPELLKLAFHIFVVIVGVLILSGAVNTSIIGANGVLNRVAEDGVLLDWFRKPHKRFGTTYRIVNMIALLQILTILMSRGDVYLLGEAYAFGVVWSFFLKSAGVLALRYQRHDQEYKFPFNFRIGGVEIPVGLGVTTLILGFVAIANLFSKKYATIYGVGFTLIVFAVFTLSEHINSKKRKLSADHKPLEEFNLDHQPQVNAATLHARPACVLVAVRDYHNMEHLKKVLEKINLRRHDIVVMTVRTISTGAGEYDLSDEQIFSDYEKELFSHVVEMAEKEGKPVELLVVPAVNPFDAVVQTASRLKASRLVTGVSPKMPSEELARQIGLAWESQPEPRHAFSLEVISKDRPSMYVNLGPHPPRLWPEDVDRLHDLWLRLCDCEGVGSKLHHRDIVGLALRRLEKDLTDGKRDQVMTDLDHELRKD
ncbi:MAG TPA: APC family permease [Bryobacteraceae bacterium]|jgi:amino acid transporter|nr:APC family permease [Bryobacteraceae bacterium]